MKSVPELQVMSGKRSSADGLAKSISVYGLALSWAHCGNMGTGRKRVRKRQRAKECELGIAMRMRNVIGEWEWEWVHTSVISLSAITVLTVGRQVESSVSPCRLLMQKSMQLFARFAAMRCPQQGRARQNCSGIQRPGHRWLSGWGPQLLRWRWWQLSWAFMLLSV